MSQWIASRILDTLIRTLPTNKAHWGFLTTAITRLNLRSGYGLSDFDRKAC